MYLGLFLLLLIVLCVDGSCQGWRLGYELMLRLTDLFFDAV